MNVYLDIDGVLLANEKSAANYADEFLQAVLAAYPDSTYWLTTRNRTKDDYQTYYSLVCDFEK